MNAERDTWLWLCASIWDNRRLPIIKTRLYLDMLETITERHGKREGGNPDTSRTDREYYMALCELMFDGTISAGEMATLEHLWRWIDAGKPEQGKARAAGRDMTEAERAADIARTIDRDQRGKSWRGD